MATYVKMKKGRVKAIVRVTGEPTRCKTFSTKQAAKQWAERTEDEIRSGTHQSREAERTTFSDVLSDYLDSPSRRHLRTLSDKARILRVWEKGEYGNDGLGKYSLSKITTTLLVKHRDAISRNTGPANVNRKLSHLSDFFNWCIRERGLLRENPVKMVPKMKEPRGRVRFLTDSERERLFKACKASSCKHLYPLVAVACFTGMRRGEILSLEWSDIDFNEGWATVHDSKNSDRRRVPLRGPALQALREWGKVRKLGQALVFYSDYTGSKFAFPERYWQLALKEAKIEDFRFHDLRHTAASYHAMSGTTQIEMMTIFGWRNPAMIRRYAHLFESHIGTVADKMIERFGN